MMAEHPMDVLFATAKRHGIPMSRVCEAAGVDPTTPSRWRRGKTRPTADKLFELQVALSTLVSTQKGEAA
jgi:transcriptional regulator with XRE-family HTH domain